LIDIAHIHPMLIHFPLALLPVALGAQLLALIKGQGLFSHQCLASTGIALIALAALAAIAAAVFGDIALDKAVAAGVPLSSLETHEELGKLSAALITLLAVFEGWLFRKTNTNHKVNWGAWFTGLVVFLLLASTAWFGGQLVYELGVNVSIVPIK